MRITQSRLPGLKVPTTPPKTSRMGGFIQGVILFGIALLAVVIAAFSFSNKSTNSSTDAEEAKTFASTIITHGGTIKTAVDRFRIDRGDLTGMTFNNTAPAGLFNNTDNFIVTLTMPARAYQTAPTMTTISDTQNGAYFLKSTGTITIGGNTVTRIVTTTGLTDRVCTRINVNIHGSAFVQTIPTTGVTGTAAIFQGAAGNITIPTTAFTNISPAVAALEEGCVQIGTGATASRIYFKVLSRS